MQYKGAMLSCPHDLIAVGNARGCITGHTLIIAQTFRKILTPIL